MCQCLLLSSTLLMLTRHSFLSLSLPCSQLRGDGPGRAPAAQGQDQAVQATGECLSQYPAASAVCVQHSASNSPSWMLGNPAGKKKGELVAQK